MGIKIPYSEDEINKASNKIISTQKVENGYVRPVVWRGSEMMAISAQQTKIHVAIATWEWGSYFDPKLKVEGIKLNISNWRRPAPNTIPWDTKAFVSQGIVLGAGLRQFEIFNLIPSTLSLGSKYEPHSQVAIAT